MDSSAQIWNTLSNIYGSKTTSRLMCYRRALHYQRKGDLSIKEFLMKIKGFCDSLASCGEIISEHEHVIAILNGLPTEFESAITIITASQVSYKVQTITTILLDVEVRMHAVVVDIPVSANVVTHSYDLLLCLLCLLIVPHLLHVINVVGVEGVSLILVSSVSYVVGLDTWWTDVIIISMLHISVQVINHYRRIFV